MLHTIMLRLKIYRSPCYVFQMERLDRLQARSFIMEKSSSLFSKDQMLVCPCHGSLLHRLVSPMVFLNEIHSLSKRFNSIMMACRIFNTKGMLLRLTMY